MALVLDGSTGIVAGNLASDAITSAALPAGTVIQVNQDVLRTTIASNTGGTHVDIGLSVDTTQQKNESKYLISGNVFMSSNYTNMSHALILQRKIGAGSWADVSNAKGTDPAVGYGVTAWWAKTGADTSVGDGWQLTFEFLDTPAQASGTVVSYRIMARAYSGYMYINRSGRNNHATFDVFPISTITVKEIVA